MRAVLWATAIATVASLIGSPVAARDNPLTPALKQLAAQGLDAPVAREAASHAPGTIYLRGTGRVLVDIRLPDTTPATLAKLAEVGARVRVVDDSLSMATVGVAPAQLNALAPLVESAQEVLRPVVRSACPTGWVVSSGDTQLKADLARAQVHVTGRDITVGIISDSFNQLGGQANDVQNGELPGGANPCGDIDDVVSLRDDFANEPVDEGRAMAQVVHDLAPGAKILFKTGEYGMLSMAQAIRDLAAAGADIIVDDLAYYNEPMYQDGPISNAIADVTAAGVVYFTAAGNSTVKTWPNLSSYESQSFRPVDCPDSVKSLYFLADVTCHNFGGDTASDPSYGVGLDTGGKLSYSLGWNEPWYGVGTDLDLCLLNGIDEVVTCQRNANQTTQNASEVLQYTAGGSPEDLSLVVVRHWSSTAPRFKLINNESSLIDAEYYTPGAGEVMGPTLFGHSATVPGVSVAAVPFFDSALAEWFSSRGPASLCWGPVAGTTPAAAVNPCQQVGVDLAATDGGKTSFFGKDNRFFGTSAAAPHAAAVAALLLDRQQCWTPAEVISALRASGRSVGAEPADAVGAGLVDAVATLASTAGPQCDTMPPKVDIESAKTWYNSPGIQLAVSAYDRRTVASLTCDPATVGVPVGLGTPWVFTSVVVTGEGLHTVSCVATDGEQNTGSGPASNPTVPVGIDTGPPVLKCKAAKFPVGKAGDVTATVSDSLSGPVATTAVTHVYGSKAGSFKATVTGSDRAGNTASATCPFTVTASARVKGKFVVKARIKTPYTATGMPAHAPITWTVKRGGKVVTTKKNTSNSHGKAKVKLSFASPGKYTVTAKSGKAAASATVTVKSA